jgi:hypothetical protein
MIDLIKILYPEEGIIFPIAINFNVVKSMSLKEDAVIISSETRAINIGIADGLGIKDINAAKKAFQAILNAIETAPGGKVTTVVFPPNVQCTGVSYIPY